MNINITGISWIYENKYGCLKHDFFKNYQNFKTLYLQLQTEKIFNYPVKDFGRYDSISKMTCFSIALALYDAGLSYSEQNKQNISVVCSSEKGCLQSNIEYFKDYVENGRKLSRGNLFIYTLPTTCISEASIYFKFQGPIIYLNFFEYQVSNLLMHCKMLMINQNIETSVAICVDEEKSICFILGKNGLNKLFDSEDLISITKKHINIDEVIREIIFNK